jgi:hypothetical protein
MLFSLTAVLLDLVVIIVGSMCAFMLTVATVTIRVSAVSVFVRRTCSIKLPRFVNFSQYAFDTWILQYDVFFTVAVTLMVVDLVVVMTLWL